MRVTIRYRGRQQVKTGIIILLLALLTAAGSVYNPILAQDETPEIPADVPADTPADIPAQTAGERGKVLAWVGSGRSAESRPGSSASELGYLGAGGEWELLLTLPQTFVGVYPCGDRALSPDGRRFTFLVHEPRGGKDGGTLYQITDAGQPVAVGPAHALTCAGGDPFQYSPDSQRLAYIDFDYSENRIYVTGTLRVLNSDTLQPVGEYPNAASFTLTERDLFFTRFYTNQSGAVDEIAVMVVSPLVDGTANEVATLFPPVGCRFTSAQIMPIAGKLAVLAGQRCSGGSQWQFYTLNRDGGGLITSPAVSSGAFTSQTRTNWLIPSWDDRTLLFSVADGALNNTARLFTLPMATTETGSVDSRTALIDGGVRFPGYSFSRFPSSNVAMPQISPDGRYWVMVEGRTAGSNLHVIDRAQPSISFDLIFVAGTVSQVFFSPDSRTLYATIGETTGASNRLQSWDLTTLVADTTAEDATAETPPMPNRTLLEGAYGRTLIYPDGRAVAAVIWQRGTDNSQTLYQTLARISLEDGQVLQGLLTPEQMIGYNEATGLVNFQRFVYPLAILGTSGGAASAPDAGTGDGTP